MNKKITLSAIDTQITPIIHAIQYDTDRQLECYFDDIDITGVTAARLYALKPDATEVYTDCTLANGYIIAPLDSQTLAVVGTVNCQMQLTINGTLTTFLFNVIVDKSLVSSSAIPSSNEYTALETLIDEAQDVIDGLPSKVSKSGDSMSGNLDMTDNKIVNLGAPTADADAANKEYVDDAVSSVAITVDSALSDTSENPVQNKVVKSAIDGKLSLSGGTMSGNIAMGNNRIQNVFEIALSSGSSGNQSRITGNQSVINGVSIVSGLITPTSNDWATNKKYVDTQDALNEKLANKVTAISSASTDTEYPSAKCVYDAIDAVPVITIDSSLDAQSANPVENGVITSALGGKEDTSNKVTSIDNTSTDTQYVSAKCAYDNLVLKEDVANKVTSISAASTDNEYPSAKCVYDLIGDINTILANLATP